MTRLHRDSEGRNSALQKYNESDDPCSHETDITILDVENTMEDVGIVAR